MILTLDDVKTQLRLEPDFTEHDDMLTKMVAAAQKSIERDYYCKLVGSDDELQALPEGSLGTSESMMTSIRIGITTSLTT